MTLEEVLAKYPEAVAFKTPETNHIVYYRQMSKAEFDTIVRLSPGENVSFDGEEYICNHLILFPDIKDLEDLTNIDIRTLAEQVIETSGFFKIEDFIDAVRTYRETNKILSEQALVFIAKAFPIYKIEELEDMSSKQIARLLALSEDMIGMAFPLPGDMPEEQEPARQSLGQMLKQGPLTDEQRIMQKRNVESSQEVLKQLKERG
jgi:hypothetical protein